LFAFGHSWTDYSSDKATLLVFTLMSDSVIIDWKKTCSRSCSVVRSTRMRQRKMHRWKNGRKCLLKNVSFHVYFLLQEMACGCWRRITKF